MKLRFAVFIGLFAVLAMACIATDGTAQSSDQTVTTQQYGSSTQTQQGMSSPPPAVGGSGPTAAPPAYGYSRPGESPGAGAGTGLSTSSDQQMGTAPGSTMSSPDQSSTYRSYRSESSTSTMPPSTAPYSSDTTTTRRYGATEPTPHGVTPSPLPRSEGGSGPTAAPPAYGYSRPGESPGAGAGTGVWSRSDQQMGTAPGSTMSSPDQSSTYRSYRSESSTSTMPPSATDTYRSGTMSSTMDSTRMRSYGVDGSGVAAAPPAWGYSRPGESPGPGAGTGLSGSTITSPSPSPAPAPAP